MQLDADGYVKTALQEKQDLQSQKLRMRIVKMVILLNSLEKYLSAALIKFKSHLTY